jgi:hypothetical protein
MSPKKVATLPAFWRFLLASLLISSFTLAAPRAAAQAKQQPQDRQWSVKILGQKLKMTVSEQEIVCRKRKRVTLTIPVAQVTELTYDIVAHSKGRGALKTLGGAGSGEGAVLAAGPLLVGAAIAAPFKTKKHFVGIQWREEGWERKETFEVSKTDYQAILMELARVTRKPWEDLPEARNKLGKELEQARDKFLLKLDRKAFIGAVELKAGLYQLVLLEHGPDRGELYFLRGAGVNPQKLVAQAMVGIDKRATQAPGSRATYKLGNGSDAIVEIQVPDKTLRFSQSPTDEPHHP